MCKPSQEAKKTFKAKPGADLRIGTAAGGLAAFHSPGVPATECVACVETGQVLTLSGKLTRREFQVASLMRAGATTRAIAEQLCIGKATVRNHVQNIFSKLKVHTRLEAVAFVNQIIQRTTGIGTDRKPSG